MKWLTEVFASQSSLHPTIGERAGSDNDREVVIPGADKGGVTIDCGCNA